MKAIFIKDFCYAAPDYKHCPHDKAGSMTKMLCCWCGEYSFPAHGDHLEPFLRDDGR